MLFKPEPRGTIMIKGAKDAKVLLMSKGPVTINNLPSFIGCYYKKKGIDLSILKSHISLVHSQLTLK
jgi:hypothetical protein